METVLVIGAARSGLAVAKLLHKHGYDVSITDGREIDEKPVLEQMGIHVFDGGHPSTLQHDKWTFVVKNPGIPYHTPFIAYFVEQGMRIYTEIEVASWYAKNYHYGAITGTNGKTTITTLLYQMLKHRGKAFTAGNIGTPLSEVVNEHEVEELYIALELSNFQLLGMESFHPEVSVVCNLAPDHLDYMDSLEEYYVSKMKIYQSQVHGDWFIRNVDDENIMKYAIDIPCDVIDISMTRKDTHIYVDNGYVYFRGMKLFAISDLHVRGDYNVFNAAVAASMAYKLGVGVSDIQECIRGFRAVEHRLEYIGECDGISFYNDSKATNTHAVVAALKAFHEPIVLLAGGHDKGLSFDELSVFDSQIRCGIGFGETKEKIAHLFTKHQIVETMKEALDAAVQVAQKGDVILLSPACSSYDQFKNYEVRGKEFKKMVQAYLSERGCK